MSAYLQMGHDSRNLLNEPNLSAFGGAILSPVNDDEHHVNRLIDDHNSPGFEIILDPQLYLPNSERGQLSNWSYFPEDVDTADHTSLEWWGQVISNLIEAIQRLNLEAVCSPAILPRQFNERYYKLCLNIGEMLSSSLPNEISVLQTVIVDMADMAESDKAEIVASLITASKLDRIYMVLSSDVSPRREMSDASEIFGTMRCIRMLRDAGMEVLMGFCSSDVILWKTAGANSCGSGKFFNIRRFTRSRFGEPDEGWGQLPYWFEESLMAFIREPDILRLNSRNLLSEVSLTNPFSQQILNQLETQPSAPWLGLSWRQYLYWFADFERRFEDGQIAPVQMLREVDRKWSYLDTMNILMDERQNDGSWIRPWLAAMVDLDN